MTTHVYLTTGQVAERLGRTTETVRTYIERGYFPNAWRPPGGRWQVPEADLAAFIERMKAKATG